MIDNIADAIPQNVVLSDAERSAILEIGLLCIASDRRVDPDEEKAFRAIAKKLGETKTDAILGKLSDSPTREEADARLVALAGQLASDPACIGTVCIAPPILDPGSPALARRALGKRRIVGAVRSLPLADTVLKPVAKRLLRRGPSSSVLKSLSHLDRARIVFLYGQPLEDDHYDPRGLEKVNAALANLPERERARFELRLLDAGPLTIFDSLSASAQEEIVHTVATEVQDCFSLRNATRAHA